MEIEIEKFNDLKNSLYIQDGEESNTDWNFGFKNVKGHHLA